MTSRRDQRARDMLDVSRITRGTHQVLRHPVPSRRNTSHFERQFSQ